MTPLGFPRAKDVVGVIHYVLGGGRHQRHMNELAELGGLVDILKSAGVPPDFIAELTVMGVHTVDDLRRYAAGRASDIGGLIVVLQELHQTPGGDVGPRVSASPVIGTPGPPS